MLKNGVKFYPILHENINDIYLKNNWFENQWYSHQGIGFEDTFHSSFTVFILGLLIKLVGDIVIFITTERTETQHWHLRNRFSYIDTRKSNVKCDISDEWWYIIKKSKGEGLLGWVLRLRLLGARLVTRLGAKVDQKHQNNENNLNHTQFKFTCSTGW